MKHFSLFDLATCTILGLFAIQMLVEALEDSISFIEEDVADVLIPLITFVILILFFVAIVKRR